MPKKHKKITNKTDKPLLFQSFKRINKDSIYIIFSDIIFYLSLVLILMLAFDISVSALEKINDIPPFLAKVQWYMDSATDTTQLEQETDTMMSLINTMIIKTVVIICSAFILVYGMTTALKGFIWAKTKGIKPDFIFFRKFLCLRLVWHIIWALIFTVILAIVKKELDITYGIVLTILFIYFTMIMLSVFEKEKKILSVIGKAFSLGIKRFYMFLVPCIIGSIIPLATYFMLSLLAPLISENVVWIVYLIFMVVFLAWFRIYFSMVVDRVENKK